MTAVAADLTNTRPATVRRGLLVALALGQLAAPFVIDAAGGGAFTTADRSGEPPIVPAGYAFSIWGLIYLSCLAYAVYQLVPRQRVRAVHRRTGWWLAAAFAASTVWVPLFGSGHLGLAQVVVVGLVALLAVAGWRMTRSGPAPEVADRFLFRLPLTLYLGWATVSAAAGFGTTFRFLGVPERGGWMTGLSILMVLVTTLAAVIAVSSLAAAAGYAGATCWALVAMAVATPEGLVQVGTLVGLVVVLATLVGRASRSRRPDVVLLG